MTRLRTGTVRSAAARVALALIAFVSLVLTAPAQEAPAPQPSVPPAVTEASAAAPVAPDKVTSGIDLNDIQDIYFKTNSHIVDLSFWYRGSSKTPNPTKRG